MLESFYLEKVAYSKRYISSSPGQFFGSSNSRRYYSILKPFCCNVTIRDLGAKLRVAFLLFQIWKKLWCFKFRESVHFVEQKYDLLLKQSRKLKIPNTVLERRTMWFSSYENRRLKVKLWWVEACERKRRYFLYRLFCPTQIFWTFLFFLNV